MKIKLTCNWTSSEEITRRLIEQFNTGTDLDDIEFVYSDDYELLVAFGYITEIPKNNNPVFVFPQEPTWSGNHQKYFNNIPNVKIFGFNDFDYSPKENVIETLSHMFYGGTGPIQEGWDFWNYENITKNKFDKTKEICSFISNRGIDHTEFTNGCLYPQRVNLVKSINEKLSFLNFYGWGDGNGKNLKPFTPKKCEVLKDYKFCLTIENSSEPNYLSEKFYDCILTDTVPIYFGCENIEEHWFEKGFIKLENITDMEYVTDKLNWINDNSEDLYKELYPRIQKMKKRYFEEFNLIKKIKKEFNEL